MKNQNLNRLGLFSRHPELVSGSCCCNNRGEMLKRVQHDKFMRRRCGFTLIELLVVILIIGILSAVALPQYQLAVDKARYTQVRTFAESLIQAEKRYILENDVFTTKFKELDLVVPHPENIKESVGGDEYEDKSIGLNCQLHNTTYVQCKIPMGTGSVWYYGYPSNPKRWCRVQFSTNERADRLCRAVTGKKSEEGSMKGNYKEYLF